MDTKHTPGPWLLARGKPRLLVYALNQQGYNRFSTHVQCGHIAPMERTSDAEVAANARLIAAAPDLLEACKNAIDILMTDRQAFVDCNQLRDCRTDDPIANGLVFVQKDAWITPDDAEALRDYDRAIEQLTAAIAKATGSTT